MIDEIIIMQIKFADEVPILILCIKERIIFLNISKYFQYIQ